MYLKNKGATMMRMHHSGTLVIYTTLTALSHTLVV